MATIKKRSRVEKNGVSDELFKCEWKPLAFYESVRRQVRADMQSGGCYRFVGESTRQYTDTLYEEMDWRWIKFTPIDCLDNWPWCQMTKIEERTTANVDVVLEKVCRSLPHGGDNEGRKYVANKLMQSMKKGNITLEGLRPVASRAFSELSRRKSA
jgi:hypothetical protein